MATIRDVARLARVSVATVSRVLNGSNKVSFRSRMAVLQAQKELGFYLNANARALVQRDSHTIGIVVSEISDPYFGAAVRACDDAIHEMGYTLLVGQGYHNADRERRAIDDLLSYQCRGLIIHALALSDAELKHYMDNVPYMVLINRILPGYEDRCLNCDNYMGECLAIEELIAHGHRKIAFINSLHNIMDSEERLQGYRDTLAKYNIVYNPDLVFKGTPSLEGGAEAAKILLERFEPIKDFTAVACYSDVMAAGLMATLHHHHLRIPEDISIIGFDNLYLSYCLIPALSTVNNPVTLMAKEAVLRSLDLYEGNAVAEPHRMDVKLISRESVAAPAIIRKVGVTRKSRQSASSGTTTSATATTKATKATPKKASASKAKTAAAKTTSAKSAATAATAAATTTTAPTTTTAAVKKSTRKASASATADPVLPLMASVPEDSAEVRSTAKKASSKAKTAPVVAKAEPATNATKATAKTAAKTTPVKKATPVTKAKAKGTAEDKATSVAKANAATKAAKATTTSKGAASKNAATTTRTAKSKA